MSRLTRISLAVILAIMLTITTFGIPAFAGTTLTKPTIKEITVSGTTFTVKAKRYSNITGYQIKYSTSSKFTNSKYVRVKTTKSLSKKVTGLKSNKKYYVKIRTYKVKNSKTTNSAWSSYRTAKTPVAAPFTTGYTTNNTTNLYTKKDSKSSSISVWYNTKLTKIKNISSSSAGIWKSVSYYNPNTQKSKTYYLWEGKDETKLSSKGSSRSYVKTGDVRDKVLAKAIYILKNWDTVYDYSKEGYEGQQNADGKYPLDCSGFVSYVFNKKMSQYCDWLGLATEPKAMAEQADQVVGYDQNGNSIKSKTICTGTLSFSKLQPGDVLFFRTNNDSSISHVGIYLGNKELIHSTRVYERFPGDTIKSGPYKGNATGGVTISPLSGDAYDNFKKAVRFVPAGIEVE